jgi:hypothetical protein
MEDRHMSVTLIDLDFTAQEADELVAAVSRHCTCFEHDQAGTIECAGHRSLSQRSELKRLLFARRMKELWRSSEFGVGSQTAA